MNIGDFNCYIATERTKKMRTKLESVILPIVLLSCLFVNNAWSGVIFEDNFDNQPDWIPNGLYQGWTQNNGWFGGATTKPVNWDAVKTQQLWSQYAKYDAGGNLNAAAATPGAQPANSIRGGTPYTTTGKAYVQYNESNDPVGLNGWASDATLQKTLPGDYPEVYVQYKIKFQGGFKRYWAAGESFSPKTFRVSHWNRTGSALAMHAAGTNAPMAIYDPGQNEYGAAYASDSIRCGPLYVSGAYDCTYIDTKYYLPGTWPTSSTYSDTSSQSIFDGNWHTIKYHLKLNSVAGAADGVYETWIDGVLVKSLTNRVWVWTGGNVAESGWNSFALGGNVYNNYMKITTPNTYQTGAQQWYAIDDVVVSTTEIPANYVIGGVGVATPQAPKNVTVTPVK